MTSDLDYWKFLAGLGLFLYGMERLEDTLKDLAGKKFKLFLKKNTKNRFLAILNGVIATAILQSSSIVLLLVIAFAGIGILSLSNSLGIILGANLGTTMTGWLVSSIGFGTKIENFIFPMIASGSLCLMFVPRRFKFHQIFGLLVAIGLLLMGLEYMKTSMQDLSKRFDIKEIAAYGNYAFFIFGFAVTAIIQSSSAMLTITLSALHANLISIGPAAYIAIGADLGTTMTGLLASFNGTAVKKRVGIAHFLFNIGTAVFALASVDLLLGLIQNYLMISNPLMTLVSFHSLFNVLGIIVFFPFLGIFEKFLNRLFQKDHSPCTFVPKVNTEIPEASLAAIRLELIELLRKVLQFNVFVIGLSKNFFQPKEGEDHTFLEFFFATVDDGTEYSQIKKIEDELLVYLANLQREKLENLEAVELSRYILSLRNAVQSAKSVKDIEHNFKEFQQSIIPSEEEFIHLIHESYLPVYELINSATKEEQKTGHHQPLRAFLNKNEKAYQIVNTWIYQEIAPKVGANTRTATFLNVNREVYTALLHFIEALDDLQEK